jgi:hypothetical protein
VQFTQLDIPDPVYANGGHDANGEQIACPWHAKASLPALLSRGP